MRATLARHLELALRRYGDELRGLHEHLSQSRSRVTVDEASAPTYPGWRKTSSN